MARRIKPYQQGALDGLCGMHAIINALYVLFPEMNKKQAQRLFRILIKKIARKRGIRVMWRGIDAQLLRQLLSVAADRLKRGRSTDIKVTRPFASGRIELPDMIQVLRAKLSHRCVAIALVHENVWHWTVIQKVTEKSIILFDSGGLGAIRIENCALAKAEKRYLINPEHMLFLRRGRKRDAD